MRPETSFKSVSAEKALVWDLPLRVFHWAMVGVVALAAATGYFAPDSWLSLHVYFGYGLILLLAFRMIWGLVGSYYSRFSSFPLSGEALKVHFSALLRARPKPHMGHNPAGAWMIVALLGTLILLSLSGLIVLGGEENLGPLAAMVSYRVGHFAEEIHESLAGILMTMIGLHLLAVLIEVKIFRHPILKAMINGKKSAAEDYNPVAGAKIIRGALIFILSTAIVLYAGQKLSALPNEGWRALNAPAAYSTECGDCHDSYHPSLRTASDWQAILAGLDDHYGEDASVDAKSLALIENYLTHNDATTFDTEVAHKIGRVSTASLRMTDTRFWKKQHRKIDKALFHSPAVGSKINCNACHKDAASGRFADSAVQLPKGGKK